MNTNNQQPPPLFAWWMFWVAMQSGIPMFYRFLSKASREQPSQADSWLWLVAVLPLVFSCVIRWIVLPRLTNAMMALPVFVVGLALAEACCLLGLFLFPAHKLDLTVIAFLGIFQYIPFFARRYFPRGNE
jgi:hypothetical protein